MYETAWKYGRTGASAAPGSGVVAQAASEAQAQAVDGPAQTISGVTEARAASQRLYHGAVDLAADRRSDSQTLRGALRPLARVADADRDGLERAEARASGARARRDRHRPLARRALASDKKNAARRSRCGLMLAPSGRNARRANHVNPAAQCPCPGRTPQANDPTIAGHRNQIDRSTHLPMVKKSSVVVLEPIPKPPLTI